MALKDIAIHIKATGVEQTAQAMQKLEGAADSMGRKVTSATAQAAANHARVEKAVGGVGNATGRAAGELDKMEKAGRRMGDLMHGHGNRAFLGMSQLETGIMSVTMRVMNLTMAAALIAAPFAAFFSLMKGGISVVDAFAVSVLQIAAQLTQMQAGNGNSIAITFQRSAAYAEVMAEKLEEIDANSFANNKGLTAMLQTMTMQGTVLDVNNRKQVETFTSLSNAIAMYTAGQDQEIQARQEMRALLTGEVNQHSQLARIIDTQIKRQGDYKGGLKELVQLGNQHGDTLERLSPYLVGVNAASESINKTWSAASSSLETAVNKVTREGFKEAFADIVPMVSSLADDLKNSSGVSDAIRKTWLAAKGVIGTVVDLVRGPMWVVLSGIGGLTVKMLDGWGLLLSSVLPVIADEFRHLINLLNAAVNMAMSFGLVMLDAVGAVGSAIASVGKAAFQALTGDFDAAGKTLQGMFSGVYVEKFKGNLEVVKGTAIAIREELNAMKDPMGRMLDKAGQYLSTTQRARGTVAAPPGAAGGAGGTDAAEEAKQVAAAAEELRLYSSAMENFNSQIRQTNPLLDEHEKRLQDVDAAVEKAVAATPKYAQELRAAGEVIKANLNLSRQMKDALDLQANMTSAWEGQQRQNAERAEAAAKEFASLMQDNIALRDEIAVDRVSPWERETAAAERSYARQMELEKAKLAAMEEGTELRAAQIERIRLLEEKYVQESVQAERNRWQDNASITANALGQIGDALMQGNRDQFEAGKAMMMGQAVIAAALAIVQAYAQLGPIGGSIAAVGVGIATLAQISKIEATEYEPRALGGPVVAGGSYLVGEQGPELIRMGSAGTVIPNNALARAGEAQLKATRENTLAVQNLAENFHQVSGSLKDLVLIATNNGLTAARIAGVGMPKGTSFWDDAVDWAKGDVRGALSGGDSLLKSTIAGHRWTLQPNSMDNLTDSIAYGVANWLQSMGLGSLANKVIGGKVSLKGAGLQLGYQDGALSASQYTTVKKDGGLFHSDKTTTKLTAIDDALMASFNEIADSIAQSVNTAGAALGGLSIDLSSLSLAATKLDLRGKSEEEATKAIEEWFGKLSIAMAEQLGGPEAQAQLAAATRFGETSYAALMRVTIGLQALQEAARVTNGVMLEASIANGDLASSIIDSFGGLEKFRSAVDKYNKVVNSDDEYGVIRLAAAHREISSALSDQLDTIPRTVSQYRALVESTDMTSPLYRTLLGLSDAFGVIGDSAKKAIDQIEDLRGTILDLTMSDPTLSPEALYNTTSTRFAMNAALAAQGNAEAIAALSGDANASLDASRGYYASSIGYQEDFSYVTSMLERVSQSIAAANGLEAPRFDDGVYSYPASVDTPEGKTRAVVGKSATGEEGDVVAELRGLRQQATQNNEELRKNNEELRKSNVELRALLSHQTAANQTVVAELTGMKRQFAEVESALRRANSR